MVPKPALISFCCLAAIAAFSIGCGSGSASFRGPGPCTGTFDVVGDWTLTTPTASGPGVIGSSGLAVFVQTNQPTPGDTVTYPAITGACAFSGTATAYITQAAGGGTASDTVSGNVNSTTSISGSITNGGNFSMAPNSPLSGSVTALSGNGFSGAFIGSTQLPLIWNIVLTPSGTGVSMSFSGFGTLASGADCFMSGTFNQEGGNLSTLNVFDISITSLDTGCPIGGTITGLGFESSTDYFGLNGGAPGTYFYAIPSTAAMVLEVFLPSAR